MIQMQIIQEESDEFWNLASSSFQHHFSFHISTAANFDICSDIQCDTLLQKPLSENANVPKKSFGRNFCETENVCCLT